MTEPVKTEETARLDELAAVTKAYGRYSGPSTGLAAALTGAWLLGCEWALRTAGRPGEGMYAVAPIAWIVLVTLARSYYQRHGEVVISTEELPGTRQLSFVMIWVVSVYGVARLLGATPDRWDYFVVAAFVAVPMLAIRFLRDGSQLSMVMILTAWAAQVQYPLFREAWVEGFRVAFAALFVVFGVLQHLRYRRLERRLRALRGTSA